MRKLSCHVCGMWIEIQRVERRARPQESCHVCGMWIEIGLQRRLSAVLLRHATYVACGLKYQGFGAAIHAEQVMPRMWHVD